MGRESSLRFAVLGSGSAGNCVAVCAGGVCVLLDAGFSRQATFDRLGQAGIDPASVAAVILTHEHGDHAAHAGRLSAALDIPVYASAGTRLAAARCIEGATSVDEVAAGRDLRFGPLRIEPVPKPHDAAEPFSFLVHAAGTTLGFFTDLGHVDPVVGEAIARCHLLVMEANHDADMLARGPYHAALKRRVGGRLGHISNEDSALALARYRSDKLRLLVLAHLSAKNNHPSLVKDAFVRGMGESPGVPRYLSFQRRSLGPFNHLGELEASSL